MALQMDFLICFVISLISLAFSSTVSETWGPDGIKYVEVQRFGDDAPTCVPRQVCADVFNTTRTSEEDGSEFQEVRMLVNCKCDERHFENKCGSSRNQLVFRETTKQALITCEDSMDFDVCDHGEAAKEKHEGDYWRDNYVYYVINCVCPTNDNPRGFWQRNTRPMGSLHASRFVDFFTCRYF